MPFLIRSQNAADIIGTWSAAAAPLNTAQPWVSMGEHPAGAATIASGRELQSTAGHVFTNRAQLLTARDAYCANPWAAEATYGVIGSWDVSAITDMSFLFCAGNSLQFRGAGGQDCNSACSTFNGDVSNWNVARVTTLLVRHRLLAPL